MPISQRTVQICLLLFAAIGLFGGTLQMSLGQPDTTPRLDNVHRFLAGIYLGCGIVARWAGRHGPPAGHPDLSARAWRLPRRHRAADA